MVQFGGTSALRAVRAAASLSVLTATLLAGPALADDAAGRISVPMKLVTPTGAGDSVGTIALSNSRYGLLIVPSLSGLPAGPHGLHVHANPTCSPGLGPNGTPVPGLAAGGHFDPAGSNAHEGPYVEGHAGDLPVLQVAADGTASLPVLAPRLRLEQVRGRALMLHAGGDNYADKPAPLGGGGARLACGVIPD